MNRDVPLRPSRAEIAAAAGRTVPDVLAPGLRVLFCGINPGLYSGATGHHFARPGNRFWRTIHGAGFTTRILSPWEEAALLEAGLGITNLVSRATATAAELPAAELRVGAVRLRRLAAEYRPAFIAVLGVSAYGVAIADRGAVVGARPGRLGPSRLWVLPNPSGLNASYQLPALVAAFARLREAVEAG